MALKGIWNDCFSLRENAVLKTLLRIVRNNQVKIMEEALRWRLVLSLVCVIEEADWTVASLTVIG